MREKYFIGLSLTYLDMFLEDKKPKEYSEVRELKKLLLKIGKNLFKSQKEAIDTTVKFTEKIEEIVNHQEIEGNLLVLATGLLFLLVEDNYFKGSNAMAVKRLCWDIYSKVEVNFQATSEFRNSNELIVKIDEEIKNV